MERVMEDEQSEDHIQRQVEPRSFQQLESLMARELRCLKCDAPVPNIVCGRKQPCPVCGFPYPLGDCSDLAEN